MGFINFYKQQSSNEKLTEHIESENLSIGSSDQEAAVVQIDQNTKSIGYISVIFLIFNRCLGAGIYSTSSTIYLLSGSVGTTLIMWTLGGIISFSGLLVYLELGSAIPRNGGEKNYLEYMFQKPKFLITAMYASYVFFLGWAANNSIIVGEYLLNAFDKEVTQWNSRAIGIGVITFSFLINGLHIRSGLILGNILGTFKIFIVLFMIVTGWVALGKGIKMNGFQPTSNFKNAFSGTIPTGFGIVNALYNVIWSFVGYSNANYALGEVKNPVKALRFCGSIAFFSLVVIYMLVNIAYFAVVPKEEIANAGRILAALFFRHAFGKTAEKASSIFVALSALGNVLSVIFSQGRIVQQLGREGCLPFSRFFATSKPFNSPFVGLMQHWIICIVTMVVPPPGDAYNFVLNLISYPLNVVNTVVAFGLLWIYYQKYKGQVEWNPPINAGIPVIFFFFISSIYLIVAPYIPPSTGQSVYKSLPYWIHPVVTWGVFAIGLLYWFIWVKVLPYFGNYTLVSKEILGEDGFWRNKIYKVSNGDANKDTDRRVNSLNDLSIKG